MKAPSKARTITKLPVPMRRDRELACTRCGADASFGYTSAQNPALHEGVRLCMSCNELRKKGKLKR